MAKEVIVIKADPKPTMKTATKTKKLKVAAYCRVSTEADEQLNSFENQVSYYTEYINSREEYEMAGIYADEGITGTSTKRRKDFRKMIADCEDGKIDLIIAKSISRFARNTQDCLSYSRKLKNMGIGVYFEKEGINTLDSAGELLFTILSSLAQEESRSISENCKWGIRKGFSDGKLHLNADRFLGYDKDEDGELIINPEQAVTVKRIFTEFMDGINPDVIAKRLNDEGIPGCMGKPRWTCGTIFGILQNEKYMGDACLQKTYTADFLTKKMEKNNGELTQYYIEDDHEAIIDKKMWKAVQQEIARRNRYKEEHGLRTLGRYTDEQPFSNRVICGTCGHIYWRRTLTRSNGKFKVWMCGQRYREKGVKGCESDSVYEKTIHEAFVTAWNTLLAKRDEKMPVWKENMEKGDELLSYRSRQMIELTKGKPLKRISLALVGKVLDHCTVYKKRIDFKLLDGTVISAEI